MQYGNVQVAGNLATKRSGMSGPGLEEDVEAQEGFCISLWSWSCFVLKYGSSDIEFEAKSGGPEERIKLSYEREGTIRGAESNYARRRGIQGAGRELILDGSTDDYLGQKGRQREVCSGRIWKLSFDGFGFLSELRNKVMKCNHREGIKR